MKDVPEQTFAPITSSAIPVAMEEGSDGGEEEDGLFAGKDEDEEEEESGVDEAMEEIMDGPSTNGVKRKLVEEEDYD
jgi:transcription initiation factor TFIID subunit 9B